MVLFQILRNSASDESTVYVHDKSGSQDRDYDLDRGVYAGNSDAVYTGISIFSNELVIDFSLTQIRLHAN